MFRHDRGLRGRQQQHTPCYSVETPIGVMGQTGPSAWKNASGMQVATSTQDMMGNTTITCTGGQPVVLNTQACASAFPDRNAMQTCPMGACM